MVYSHPLALWRLEVPQQSLSSFRNTKGIHWILQTAKISSWFCGSAFSPKLTRSQAQCLTLWLVGRYMLSGYVSDSRQLQTVLQPQRPPNLHDGSYYLSKACFRASIIQLTTQISSSSRLLICKSRRPCLHKTRGNKHRPTKISIRS